MGERLALGRSRRETEAQRSSAGVVLGGAGSFLGVPRCPPCDAVYVPQGTAPPRAVPRRPPRPWGHFRFGGGSARPRSFSVLITRGFQAATNRNLGRGGSASRHVSLGSFHTLRPPKPLSPTPPFPPPAAPPPPVPVLSSARLSPAPKPARSAGWGLMDTPSPPPRWSGAGKPNIHPPSPQKHGGGEATGQNKLEIHKPALIHPKSVLKKAKG